MTRLVENALFYVRTPMVVYKAVRIQRNRTEETYHSLVKPRSRWPIHTDAGNSDYRYSFNAEVYSDYPGIMTVGNLEDARHLMMFHFNEGNRKGVGLRNVLIEGYAVLMGQIRGDVRLAFDEIKEGKTFALCAQFFTPFSIKEKVYFDVKPQRRPTRGRIYNPKKEGA